MTEIFTAKTVEEAKAMAVKKFGKKPGEIKFEVIEEGKKGFLGIGQVDAKVKATYVAPVQKTAAKPETKKEEPKKEEPKPEPVAVEEPKEEEQKPEPVAVEEPKEEEQKPEPVAVEETKEEEPKPEPVAAEKPKKEKSKKVKEPERAGEKNAENDDELNLSLEDFTIIEDESLLNEKVKIARDYITSVLRAMGVDTDFVIYQNETGALIDIKSDNNGTIIGRRGETLDSLQYLCSIIANKGDKDYFRITIDCLGYRNKRKDTLRQLAEKVAKAVLKTGKSKTLEPMNPYERRVIHSVISEIEGVSSRSVGEEPYRKIVISSTNPKSGGKRRGGRRDDRKPGGGRRNDRGKKREPVELKEIDLSTSFEKDYKKPKPEDSMDVGLYGKIEW